MIDFHFLYLQTFIFILKGPGRGQCEKQWSVERNKVPAYDAIDELLHIIKMP